MAITTKLSRMNRPSSAQFCLYKYRSQEMGKTLPAIHSIFKATDVMDRLRIRRDQSGENWAGTAF